MFGVDGFTPVINPPNTCILGVGRLRDDLVLDGDGTVTTTKRLTLSLTWDHRAFDGAPAAAFCRSIVELLGDPAELLDEVGAAMIDYQDLFHIGVRVPRHRRGDGGARQQHGRHVGGAPREPGADAVDAASTVSSSSTSSTPTRPRGRSTSSCWKARPAASGTAATTPGAHHVGIWVDSVADETERWSPPGGRSSAPSATPPTARATACSATCSRRAG